MAPPQKSKQQSLTSFFSRTPSKLQSAANLPSSPPPTAPAHSLLTVRKRPLSTTEGNIVKKPRNNDPNDEDGEDSVTKRPRRAARKRIVESDNEGYGDNGNDGDDDGDEYVPEDDNDHDALTSSHPTELNVTAIPALAFGPPDQAKGKTRSAFLSQFAAGVTNTSTTDRSRHAAYVKKLGTMTTSLPMDSDEEIASDASDDEPAPAAKGKSKIKKLTPMLQQIVDIKLQHMDTLLVIEVGYKFQFFGEDARVAARTLGIMCIPGRLHYTPHPSEAHLDINKFAKASIPTHRLPIHLHRLIQAGHKVGVIRQLETAALKKASDNRNAPFVRRLTDLYTKGTYVGEIDDADMKPGVPPGGYLLCLFEEKSSLDAEKVRIGMIGVEPGTGDIVWDVFDDGFLRGELETRLLHVAPVEFLLVGDISPNTNKVVAHLSGGRENVFGDSARVEKVDLAALVGRKKGDVINLSTSHITQFFAEALKDAGGAEKKRLDEILSLPGPAMVCLSAMITHLSEYGLSHVFSLTANFSSFTSRRHMAVPGSTLEALEIYRNGVDHAAKGSLFWAVDKTLTRAGQRLLRKWLGRPLLSRDEITERLDAVEELKDKMSTMGVSRVESLLKSLRSIDLERSLIRIYYGKATAKELVTTLQALVRIGNSVPNPDADNPETSTGFLAPILQKAVLSFPEILEPAIKILDKINLKAALANNKLHMLKEDHHTDNMTTHQCGIASVEADLSDQRPFIGKALGHKIPAAFVTVSGIEYLVEVANTDLKKVPASWVKISGTKKVARFHTPEVLRLIAARDRHKEALAAAAEDAFKDLVGEVAAIYDGAREVVHGVATMDCLLSMAKAAGQPGFCKPEILPEGSAPFVGIVGGRHPVAERMMEGGYIPFSATLGTPPSVAEDGDGDPSSEDPLPTSTLAHLITGPNMGGKSSFVRALALLTLLAQTGHFVPAESLILSPLDGIYTRMGAQDNLFTGESTFMHELSTTSRILRAATPRSLVILDELGRGTSTFDGAAIAEGVLRYVVSDIGCLTMFITHYQNLARVADSLSAIRNLHMRFEKQMVDGREVVTFLYEVAEGIAERSYGVNVARLARVPETVLEVASGMSGEMERVMGGRRLGSCVRGLVRVLHGDGDEDMERLARGIEEL